MQYLNGLLSSIGDDAPPRAPGSARPAPPPAAKRKADDDLTSGPAKRPTTPANATNGDIKRPITPSSGANGASKPRPVAPAANGKYQGAARPGATATAKKPESKPQGSNGESLGVKTGLKPASGTTAKPATPTADKPAPKKGSYADILARAKAAQQSKTPVGVIQHKQGEKIDRSKALKEASKEKGGASKIKKEGDRSRTGSAEIPLRPGEKSKQRPKQLEKSDYKGSAAYSGSAKPTTPVYAGSARPGQGKKPPPKRYDGYAGTDEELDDYDEEDDYYSDSDDMEAGAFDVEREEQEALRAAKRDDAAELALENKLKAEKLERKRRLEELAAGRLKRKNTGF